MIAELLQRPKLLPRNWRSRLALRVRPELSQKTASITLRANDDEFRLSIRQSTINELDFSVIVMYRPPLENRWMRLRRYKGLHGVGEHRNRLEHQKIRGVHIHTATLRYQEHGFREEAYAEETNLYSEVHGAIKLMLSDCHFIEPSSDPDENPNLDLFSL
ncbi:MAG TPA: hypothetical protein VNF29_08390 [Candidatus Binataceae bacterium]|nr:hypothetical protein [Candidatus Binataceae bacterium]